MASWREIDRIRKDAKGFRALAARMLEFRGDVMSEWEAPFLESIVGRTDVEQYTTRQSEKLLEIRDATELVETINGFSIKTMLGQVHQARLDLSEDDEEWIVSIAAISDGKQLRRRDGYRLLRLARDLKFIEAFE